MGTETKMIGDLKQTDEAAANLQIFIQKDSRPSEFTRPLTSIALNLNGNLPVDRRRVSLLKFPIFQVLMPQSCFISNPFLFKSQLFAIVVDWFCKLSKYLRNLAETVMRFIQQNILLKVLADFNKLFNFEKFLIYVLPKI